MLLGRKKRKEINLVSREGGEQLRKLGGMKRKDGTKRIRV